MCEALRGLSPGDVVAVPNATAPDPRALPYMDLDASERYGLPPVWLTLGVGGSQAASAVV